MTEQDSKTSEDRARLQDLLAYPREDESREYKGWLDLSIEDGKANLAQGLLAMANHGGGYIILGYTESQEKQLVPECPRPPDLSGYGQDTVNNIVKRYAEPRFHCEVYHIPHPENGETFPIIKVRGGHKVPIRSRSEDPGRKHVRIDTYYIRRPGPESAPPQTAREWDELIGRCVSNARDDLLDKIRNMLYGISQSPLPASADTLERDIQKWAEESKHLWEDRVRDELSKEIPSRYEHGIWTIAYSIIGEFDPPDLKEFPYVLKRAEGTETGWPVWFIPERGHHIVEIPFPRYGVFECWMKDSRNADAAHSDFWRASPEEKMFLLRGYLEDCSPEKVDAGTSLWIHTPIFAAAECLLHSRRLSTELGVQSSQIMIGFKWEGLSGRTLRYWNSKKGEATWFDQVEKKCRQKDVTIPYQTISFEDIEPNLPEIVQSLTKDLFLAFNLYEPPMDVIQQELKNLRR